MLEKKLLHYVFKKEDQLFCTHTVSWSTHAQFEQCLVDMDISAFHLQMFRIDIWVQLSINFYLESH